MPFSAARADAGAGRHRQSCSGDDTVATNSDEKRRGFKEGGMVSFIEPKVVLNAFRNEIRLHHAFGFFKKDQAQRSCGGEKLINTEFWNPGILL